MFTTIRIDVANQWTGVIPELAPEARTTVIGNTQAMAEARAEALIEGIRQTTGRKCNIIKNSYGFGWHVWQVF